MKHFLLLSAAALTAMTVSARHLSPDEAWQRAFSESTAMKSAPASAAKAPECVMRVKAEGAAEASVYVFSAGQSGYYVMSADDVAAPVLGYSYNADFDAENLPENLRWWLDSYAREIAWAAENGATAYEAPARIAREAIAPLTTTKWNQDSPYNALCPKVGNTVTMTGCVATAMAQVMKYHNWPVKGTSSISYSWNNQTLSMDFSATNFDWNNMLDSYSSSATAVQKNAVAQLMKACGYSVSMNYGTNESGASGISVGKALLDYFNYDKGLHNAVRDAYTMSEWENLIYSDLSSNGPVFYSGSNSSSGHAFVCDGYQTDGFFHFNWGWGGMSDGYYRLSALNPGSQGIGGSTSGYNSGQVALLGVRKPQTGSQLAEPLFVAGGTPSVDVIGFNTYFFGPFFNYSTYAVNGYFTFRYVNEATGEERNVGGNASEVGVGVGVSRLSMGLGSIANGTYRFYPVFIASSGQVYPIIFPAYLEGYYRVTKTSSGIEADVPAKGELTATQVDFQSEFYLGNRFFVKASVQNSSNVDFNRSINAILLRSENMSDIAAIGNELTMDFPASSTTPVDYVGQWISRPSSAPDLTAGNYYFVFAVDNGSSIIDNTITPSYKAISQFYPVTLKTASTPSIGASLKVNGNSASIEADELSFDLTVSCSAGYFANSLTVAIFPTSGGSALNQYNSDYFFLSAGDSKTMTVNTPFPEGKVGTQYMAAVFYGSSQLTNPVLFTIGNTTGIDEVVAADWSFSYSEGIATATAPEAIAAVTVYSTTGSHCLSLDGDGSNTLSLDSSALAPGVYVATVTGVTGEKRSFKFVKR